MEIFTIIQARLNSTRLPKKVLLPFKRKTVLEFLLGNLKELNPILAITNEKELIEIAQRNNVRYFIGSEENVLERFYLTAKNFGVKDDDLIVRICSDSPFLNEKIVFDMIEEYKNCNCNYIMNTTELGTPKGLNVEVFSFECLEKAYFNCKDDFCKEHVTPWIKENCNSKFVYKKFDFSGDFTIDTKEDYERLKKVIL